MREPSWKIAAVASVLWTVAIALWIVAVILTAGLAFLPLVVKELTR